MRRAVAVFIEDKRNLILQSKALIASWRHIQDPPTDLVFMGPPSALSKLPDDVIKVPQLALTQTDPEVATYPFINSIACLVGEGTEVLDDYDFVLRSDADVFLTPAWKDFQPNEFVCGQGFYANSQAVRDNIRRVAQRLGYTHRGIHNLGSTMYGPTLQVKEVCRLSTLICRYLLATEFLTDPGAWPEWYRGVSTMYSGEIAINHAVPHVVRPNPKLDYYSTSGESVRAFPHVHCWHTNEMFSKFKHEAGAYDHLTEEGLDLEVIRDYCLAMALRAKEL